MALETGSTSKRVLLVQTAFLGDLILSVPLMKKLKKLNGASGIPVEINLVCRKGFGAFFKDLGLVDQVFEIEKRNRASYQKAFAALREEPFDLIVVPHESFTTARWVATLKGQKIGYKKFWNRLFFHERVTRDWSLPEPLRQMGLLMTIDPTLQSQFQDFRDQEQTWQSDLGKLSPVPEWASAVTKIPWDTQVHLQKHNLSDNYVCFFPGSVWATKKWSLIGYQQLGKKWAHSSQVVVMGGPGEEKVCQEVADAIPNAISLAGKTKLQETLSIVHGAKFVVSNDSAGQHLAALTGTPTVTIFGPTVLEFGFRPWNSNAIVVEKKEMSCRPCGIHGQKKCPLGHHNCMEKLPSHEVYEATEKLIIP